MARPISPDMLPRRIKNGTIRYKNRTKTSKQMKETSEPKRNKLPGEWKNITHERKMSE